MLTFQILQICHGKGRTKHNSMVVDFFSKGIILSCLAWPKQRQYIRHSIEIRAQKMYFCKILPNTIIIHLGHRIISPKYVFCNIVPNTIIIHLGHSIISPIYVFLKKTT